MAAYRNIEFFTDPQGRVMIADDRGVRTFDEEEKELVADLFSRIESDYPQAFEALSEHYHKSRANVPYYRYLIVSRFIRCNFGVYDSRADIALDGTFRLEEVQCPLRCECRYAGVICGAKLESKLTPRQEQVMRLYCQGESEESIAESLYISPETVKTIKRDAFRRVGAHSLAEFMRITQIEL